MCHGIWSLIAFLIITHGGLGCVTTELKGDILSVAGVFIPRRQGGSSEPLFTILTKLSLDV
jgi:hypothetical protein